MLIGRSHWSALIAMAGVLVACGPSGSSEDSPEHAVQRHIAAAKAGDVSALRSGTCGALAAMMQPRSDVEIRQEFANLYQAGPDVLSVDPESPGVKRTVTGHYTNATDLEISFTVEDRDGWKICEIRRGNGIFGQLPGPFEP